MSDYKPITGELRETIRSLAIDDSVLTIGGDDFHRLCAAIDAIHAELEAESDQEKCILAYLRKENVYLEDKYRDIAKENAKLREQVDTLVIYVEADGTKYSVDDDGNQHFDHSNTCTSDGWVELPKDAHGEYIRAGDTLDGYGKTIEVVELRYGRSGWVIVSRDGNGYADTFAFTHHHPDTWESIIEEALGSRWSAPNELSPDFTALVARCKKLAGDAE